jgi:hypothetical protein
MPRSLENILNPRSGVGDFPNFERQINSGAFPSLRWDAEGRPYPDWNPLQNPERGWVVYNEIFKTAFDIEAVTMANLIPWGSQTT